MLENSAVNIAGIPHHVIQRGHNLAPCFYREEDYQRYLVDLKELLRQYQCQLHAYVLMSHHIHLLVTPMIEYGLPEAMEALKSRYVSYFNNRYRQSDVKWEGRYKSCVIDSNQYLLTCMRYIELNPVRLGVAEKPGDYQWSSFHANALGENDKIVTHHHLYQMLADTASGRQEKYLKLFDDELDADTLLDIREAINNEEVLGKPDFKDKLEVFAKRHVHRGHDLLS